VISRTILLGGTGHNLSRKWVNAYPVFYEFSLPRSYQCTLCEFCPTASSFGQSQYPFRSPSPCSPSQRLASTRKRSHNHCHHHHRLLRRSNALIPTTPLIQIPIPNNKPKHTRQKQNGHNNNKHGGERIDVGIHDGPT
jgi:hypothetical protein